MKKFLLSMVVIAGLVTATQAQVRPHALGLRLGVNEGQSNSAEISYQHGLSSKNRLEINAGASSHIYSERLTLTGSYHWVWNLKGGLNWYIGPAAGLSFNRYSNNTSGFGIAVGGQLGLEYDLNKMKLPLLISVDTRPMWDIVGDSKDQMIGLALGVRYTWGKAYSSKKK